MSKAYLKYIYTHMVGLFKPLDWVKYFNNLLNIRNVVEKCGVLQVPTDRYTYIWRDEETGGQW